MSIQLNVQILLSNIVDLNKKINLAIGQNIKIEPYCIHMYWVWNWRYKNEVDYTKKIVKNM